MLYGAAYPKFAPFSGEEPADTLPQYGAALELGSLVKLDEKPSFYEKKGYGNNLVQCSVHRFKEGKVTLDITTLDNATEVAIYGAKEDAGGSDGKKDLKYNRADKAPYGGLAFYYNAVDDNDVAYCQGIFYPKVKAAIRGNTHNTMGNEITLTPEGLEFDLFMPACGDWRIKSARLDTEKEAKAWVDKKLASGV